MKYKCIIHIRLTYPEEVNLYQNRTQLMDINVKFP